MDNRLLTIMIGTAATAPSIHNTQPWHFVAHGCVVDVFADRSRAVPVVDPTGRQLVMSCGAAIEHLCITARALGRDPAVQLLPDRANPDWLARVDVSARRVASVDDRTLAKAMFQRHTVRTPFARCGVGERITGELASEASALGASAAFLTRSSDLLVAAVLLTHADEAERGNDAYLAELAGWRRENGVDGIPAAALAPTEGRRTSLPLRDFRAGDPASNAADAIGNAADELGAAAVDGAAEHDEIVVIGTPGDEPVDWLVAGRSLARLWLRATALGLAASPLTQALDREPYRSWLRRALRYQGYPQMVLRMGYEVAPVPSPPSPLAVPAPRRPIEDVVTFEGEPEAEPAKQERTASRRPVRV
ncbi:MAG: Acg family FMN-binding oxidoreductase [Frankiaceae bacterium]